VWCGGRRRYVEGLWGQVHVREWGQGRPLVLLHQTPWSGVQYHRLGPQLAKLGLRVIAPDTPGYGLSDAPEGPPSIEAYAENLRAVLKQLDLVEPVIGGHHTGALIAAAFAARKGQAIRGLILDNPPCYTTEERLQRQSLPERRDLPIEGGRHFTDRWAFLRGRADPDLSAEQLHLAVVAFYVNDATADHGHAAAYAWDMTEAIDRISAPTLVLSSRGDPIHSHGARLLQRRPDWKAAVLTRGSACAVEAPEAWRAAVEPFLTGLAP
jgi:pimeloyl-ACP methyl ester carboxylesterase